MHPEPRPLAQFYKQFFISLLQQVFEVLTDTMHKPGFPLHSSILAKVRRWWVREMAVPIIASLTINNV